MEMSLSKVASFVAHLNSVQFEVAVQEAIQSVLCWITVAADAEVSVSAFTWHSTKPNYWVSPTMIGFLRCMYTP